MYSKNTVWGYIIAQNNGSEPVVVRISEDPTIESISKTRNRFKRVYESVSVYQVVSEGSTKLQGVFKKEAVKSIEVSGENILVQEVYL